MIKNFKTPFMLIITGFSLIVLAGCYGPGTGSLSNNSNKDTVESTPKATYANGKIQEYSKEAYDKAIADGKTVMLDFHATWCSICLANKPILKAAFESIDDDNLVGFIADFDTERELKKEHNIQGQATYILLKNGKEVNRLMGPQDEEKFKTFLTNGEAMMENDEVMMEEGEAMMEKEEEAMVKANYIAGKLQPYNKEAYDAAVADGKTVMVDFYADWCPTCRGNKPHLEAAFKNAPDNVVGFVANFDEDKALKKELGVSSQSTYVLVKNGKEDSRLLGPQDEVKFKAFISG